MKNFFLMLAVGGFFSCTGILSCASMGKIQKTFNSSTYNVHPFKEIKLKNGLRVLLIDDDRLPTFSLQLLVESGSTSDPKDSPGAQFMVGALIDQGTVHQSASQIANSFGQLGASFSAHVDKEYTVVAAQGLSQHRDIILKNFFEILTEPAFSEAELQRIRSRALSGIRQVLDDPEHFSAEAFETYLYGVDHPYGRPTHGTLKSIKAMTRKTIIRQYLNTFRPNNSILAVVGNFDPNIQTQLETFTQNWEPKEVKPPPVDSFPKIEGLKIRLIERADLKQAQVRIGSEGIKRSDPDFLTVRVANSILGGMSFTSRLFDEIRIRRALTYSVDSNFDARLGVGPFEISSPTRIEKTKELIQTAFQVLETFKKTGVTEQELASAKSYLKGLFPQVLETSERLAQNLLILRFYGIKDDYLKYYFENIDRITKKDVDLAIAKHINPQNMKIQVFAPRSLLSDLKTIGEVEALTAQQLNR